MLHIVTRWNCKTSNYLLYSIIIYPILESGNKVEGRHTVLLPFKYVCMQSISILRTLRVLFFGEGLRLGEDRLQLFSLWFNTCLFIHVRLITHTTRNSLELFVKNTRVI